MRPCPRCHHEKAEASFIGPECGDCYALGPYFEPCIDERKEQTMPTGMLERRSCAKGCGKLVDPRGAHKHEATCGGNRAQTSAEPKTRKSTRRATTTNPTAPDVVGPVKANGCLFCSGQNSALAKDLMGRMLRGGMGFDAAVEVAADVAGMMASRGSPERSR